MALHKMKKTLSVDEENQFIKLPLLFVSFLTVIIYICWFIHLSFKSFAYDNSIENIIRMKSKENHFLIEFFQMLNPTISSLVSGLSAVVFCWTLTYFNWLYIGGFPATPMSPTGRNTKGYFSRPAVLSPQGLAPLLIALSSGILAWKISSGSS